jgi:hypothetical protein
MGQARRRQADIAKLKMLSAPLHTNGFDMFWTLDNLVTDRGMVDLPGITNAIATWAADPEGLGFEGTPTISVDRVEDYAFHKDGIKITLKWDNYVRINIVEALGRIRYVICGSDNLFPSYSGAEFYIKERVSKNLLEVLEAVE